MIRTIIQEGDPILRKRQPYIDLVKDKEKAAQIVTDLWDTLRDSQSVGFAANQIGEPYRICIVLPDIVLINPRVMKSTGKAYFKEGCMSIPGYYANIPRSIKMIVRVDNWPKSRILSGWQADIAQHEIDHLDGILIRDYVENKYGKKGGILIHEHDENMQSVRYYKEVEEHTIA